MTDFRVSLRRNRKFGCCITIVRKDVNKSNKVALLLFMLLSSRFACADTADDSIAHAFSEEVPQLNITSFGSDGANMDFATLCRDAKVQFFMKPDLPVHSVAHDWSSRIRRDLKNRYELDESGKILGIGWNPKIRNHVDFIEERYTPNGRFGMGNLKPLYVRQPRKGEFYGVDNLMADVLVMHDVSSPEELDKPVNQQAQLKYTLTVSDRRTGEKLASMVYWVDMLNHRACGANLKNTIDEDVFILQAAGIPIALPATEK